MPVGKGSKKQAAHVHSKLPTNPSVTAGAWERPRGARGAEGISRPFLPLPSTPGWGTSCPVRQGEAGGGGWRQLGEARHSGCCRWNKLSLWAGAWPPHGNEQRTSMCKRRAAQPHGPGRTSRSAVFFPVCAASRFLVSMETGCCRNDVMKTTSKIKANRFALL